MVMMNDGVSGKNDLMSGKDDGISEGTTTVTALKIDQILQKE
jgi:hypothetical protein